MDWGERPRDAVRCADCGKGYVATTLESGEVSLIGRKSHCENCDGSDFYRISEVGGDAERSDDRPTERARGSR